MERLNAYGDYDTKIVEREPEQQAALRKLAKGVLSFSLLLSISLSLVSVIFFSRQFKGRLAVLAENNTRFLEGKPLQPIVPGSDEIVDLDVSFHQAADELRAAEQHEKAVQQLRQRVISTITRDLRVPLDSMDKFFQSTQECKLDDQMSELKSIAVRSLERMTILVNDLVELEKIKEGKLPIDRADVSLAAAARQAQETVSSVATHKNITISVRGEGHAFGDERRIVQVLVNLLGNAVKFSPENSSIEVSIETVDSAVNISVRDQGRGIPDNMIKDIFSPFKQVETDDAIRLGGYGLGLAICRALVESHDGEISVQSTEGQGSTFSFRLPAMTAVESRSSAT
jgi:signal transduction histidine kinase